MEAEYPQSSVNAGSANLRVSEDGAAPPHFGSFYLSNQAELDFGTLSKVGDLA